MEKRVICPRRGISKARFAQQQFGGLEFCPGHPQPVFCQMHAIYRLHSACPSLRASLINGTPVLLKSSNSSSP